MITLMVDHHSKSSGLKWDAHACLPLHPEASIEPLLRYLKSGVHYVSINVGMDMNPLPQVMKTIAHFRAQLSAHESMTLAGNSTEIRAASAQGILSVGFDLEGALPFLESPDMVSLYRALGVRQAHLAYNRNNTVAGGCHDSPQGLTTLGRSIVSAMNSSGMIVDCSHMSERSALDLVETSACPVVLSHANPSKLVPHQRNVSDTLIDEIARREGVICVNGVNVFLGVSEPQIETFLDHLCYVAERVGAEHLGVGLDVGFSQPNLDDRPPPDLGLGEYQPSYWWPKEAGYQSGISDVRYLPPETWRVLPKSLSTRGFSEHEIELILGENMMRLLSKIEAYAAQA